jgi:hypothetical protein
MCALHLHPDRSSLTSKLWWDVVQHDLLLLLLSNTLLLTFQLFMLAEMLNVFRMDKILNLRIFVVKFLEMVDFVLVLIVAMVTGSEAEVGQEFSSFGVFEERCARNDAALGRVEDAEDIQNSWEELAITSTSRDEGNKPLSLTSAGVSFRDSSSSP